MDMTPDLPGMPVPDPVSALVAESAELRETIVGLRDDLRASEERNAKALRVEKSKRRKSQWWLLTAIAVDVAITIALATILSGQASTNAHLKAATAQIQESLQQNYSTAQQQAETRTRVLCPLYTVLLAATLNPSPRVADTPAQRAQFETAVGTIRAGYATLGCTPALPPASSAPPG